MKRVAFNGGELSPDLDMRSDLDIFHRGAQIIENFEVSQSGTLSRRKGTQYFADAYKDARLTSYIYSNTERYLVEVSPDFIRIFDPSSKQLLATLDSPYLETKTTVFQQLNNLLIFVSPGHQTMVLKRKDNEWIFEPYHFEIPPWRYNEYRDQPIIITGSSGTYDVTFPDGLPATELEKSSGDTLRASFWTEAQEAFNLRSNLASGINAIGGLSSGSYFDTGAKIAIRGDDSLAYYVCVKNLSVESLVSPLYLPDNYPDNFIKADTVLGFENSPVIDKLDHRAYGQGEKFRIRTGYWHLWTCIKPFNGSTDFVAGASRPDNYPGHFIQGLPVGNAVTCKGTWQFYCSGAWVGSYDIRRSFNGTSLQTEWETVGTSFSRIGSPSNTLVTGDESNEECHMRLFITKVRWSDTNPENGFPEDTCSNKLIISPYKHHTILKYVETEDEQTEQIIASEWHHISPVKVDFTGKRSIIDWSWSAFRPTYGFPALCKIFDQRLVFAATHAQPQTIWMSKTDDINNFEIGKQDDSALALTISTSTQNPICWLMPHGSRLLIGTSDAEYIVSSGSGAAITHATARIDNHGYVGSADIPAIMAIDKVLYCERGSGRLYQYGYSFESDSYTSRDLTIFADHILANGGGIVDSAISRKPETKAWFILKNGAIAIITYNSTQEVNCWHRYTTNGQVKSITTLPNISAPDDIYLIVERANGLCIETISQGENYIDHDNNHYTSTLLTNALTHPDSTARKQPITEVWFHFPQQTDPANIQITNDGKTWVNPDRTRPIPPGWDKLITSGKWDYDITVGIRVSGDRPLKIQAIQG